MRHFITPDEFIERLSIYALWHMRERYCKKLGIQDIEDIWMEVVIEMIRIKDRLYETSDFVESACPLIRLICTRKVAMHFRIHDNTRTLLIEDLHPGTVREQEDLTTLNHLNDILIFKDLEPYFENTSVLTNIMEGKPISSKDRERLKKLSRYLKVQDLLDTKKPDL